MQIEQNMGGATAELLSLPRAPLSGYFAEREDLLRQVNPSFLASAREMVDGYNKRAALHVAGSSADVVLREPRTEIKEHFPLYQVFPEPLRRTWDGTPETRPLLAEIFSWNYNRLKCARDAGGVQRVELAMRFGEIDGQPICYQVHTHFDVLYAMARLGLLYTPLNLASGCTHDALEMARNFMCSKADGIKLIEITQPVIAEAFSCRHTGRDLAITTAALTESSFDKTSEAIGRDGHAHVAEAAKPFLGAAYTAFTDADLKDRLDKIYLRDPLVFGGLAQQILKCCRSLLAAEPSDPVAEALDPGHRLALAEAVLAAEIGDRISDIATLEGDLDWFASNLDFAAHKITAYICRLRNIGEKLGLAVGELPHERRPLFQHALGCTLDLLEEKRDMIDFHLRSCGHPGLPWSAIERHFEGFRLRQTAAEEALDGYLDARVHSMLALEL